MNLILKPIKNTSKVFLVLSFAFVALLAGVLLGVGSKHSNSGTNNENFNDEYNQSMTNVTASGTANKTQRKEYLYRLLTNTTRSLIQMEIKARRLEENMRRIKEKTADLLWKNKDKALWRILFKNISRHISIRHEFHQHSSLKRILQDSHVHKHRMGRRRVSPRN